MNGLKMRLGLGIVILIFSLVLVGGGTYAYFNNDGVTQATFKAGTIKLNISSTFISNIDQVSPEKPLMIREFRLENNGSIPIEEISLNVHYEKSDSEGSTTDDFGKYIMVHFLKKPDRIKPMKMDLDLDHIRKHSMYSSTLYDLREKKNIDKVDSTIKLNEQIFVVFELLYDKEGVEQFQDRSLDVEFVFEAR